MTEPDQQANVKMAGFGYPALQLAKVLATSEQYSDPATRQRAAEKAAKWEAALQHMLAGAHEVGSRTPLKSVPAWATLEVLTGGFASGQLLAGGPLQAHEIELLQCCPGFAPGTERQTLNQYFLSDTGLTQLHAMLGNACYEVKLPEESALRVVAWLLENNDADARALPEVPTHAQPNWCGAVKNSRADNFALLCAKRAGVALGSWHTTTNGMIIEQQQILTTQNLASLLLGLDLVSCLQTDLTRMARQCLEWICQRHRMKIDGWHTELIVIKNTAYAWRQMVFFLALLSQTKQGEFLDWAGSFLAAQPSRVQERLRPALRGLQLAAQGACKRGCPFREMFREVCRRTLARNLILAKQVSRCGGKNAYALRCLHVCVWLALHIADRCNFSVGTLNARHLGGASAIDYF